METISKRELHRRQKLALYFESHNGYWMRLVSNHSQGKLTRELQANNTSIAEWIVMCHVRERPQITPGELAENLDMTRGAVSKVIDKLEAKKWVARMAKAEDGRVQLLSLTRQGSQMLPKLLEMVNHHEREFFDCLPVEERATLWRLLKKLAEFHDINKGYFNLPLKS